jgi:hypothetical protein
MYSLSDIVVPLVNIIASRALHFLDYSIITLLGVPLISALGALHFAKPAFKLGRAGYFCATGLFILLLAVGKSLIFLTYWALLDSTFSWESGLYLLAVLGIYAWFVGMGVFMGFASSARAMDGYGHRTYWFLGFIPLADLVLLLKSPRERKALTLKRLAGNTLLIAIGALLIWMVRVQVHIFSTIIDALGQ